MSSFEWVVTIGGGAIAILITIAGYFINKWIDSIEKTLEKHTESIADFTAQISTLSAAQNSQTENLTKAVQAKLATFQFPRSKLDSIEEEIVLIKNVIQERVLPQMEKQNDDLGRVIVLDNALKEQDKKIFKLFQVLEKLVLKTPPRT